MGELGITDGIPIPKTDVSMPRLGFGVYQLYGDACQKAVLAAIDAGFRHVDSAQMYRNESDVAAAVEQSPLRRQDVFLTTKIHTATSTPESTYQNALDSVNKIGGPGGYVDLFLIHVPGSSREAREQLWKALERLHDEGKAKAIGVSNFRIQHLEEMKEYARVWPPHVNQLELHPWCQHRELAQFCRDNSIILQAYSPLSCGENLDDKTLGAVAAKHARSPAQVLIRYGLQKDWVPLPKSGTPDRIKQNAAVFDFALDQDDMKKLDALDKGTTGALFPANLK
ncbi:aldo/keto reductase family protein [Hirsutella rhossiliensis]|uniref:Aldo/keto reductase family domain-containing protein n=1 Tax=Hirsutella rhossiliensis TaxID=111463 RepID=A0A9P8N6E4_9HYPO|nr:aldo/keto reductase family domain-containing protein [Hirsutella rhossiliensis]KAH0966821.1 aldo/keto reductase family domain-containing protein [Hirsutella rhossiliensis]